MRAVTAIVILLGCVPISARLARGEHRPPPALGQLANASVIVQGRYKLADGQPQFVVERVIAPENSPWAHSPGSDLRVNEAGGAAITSEVAWNSPWGFGHTRIDATRSRLWLVGVKNVEKFMPPGRLVSLPMAEPVELADGYLALRKGEPPPLLFRALQRWDALLQRDAMEEIVADKDPQTLDRLRTIADDPNSDAAGTAIGILRRMKLLDADRYWEAWTSHPAAYTLGDELLGIDRQRVAEQVLAGLKRPIDDRQLRICLSFKHLLPDEDLLPALMPHLAHASPILRGDMARFLGGRLAQFYRQREESPAAQQRFEELEQALVPLLKKGAAEDADRDARKTFQRELDQFENRWPKQEQGQPDPPPAYQPSENLKLLLSQLTLHEREGARIRRAGKELAKYEFEAGFAEMQRRLVSENFNRDMVMNGFGYIDDPRSFDFAVEQLAKIGTGHTIYPDAVRAVARLNRPKSLEVVLDAIQRKGNLDYMRAEYYFDALAEVRDERAVAEIRKLERHTQYRATLKYVRALAKHGDPWAIDQLLRAADGKAAETVLKDERWHSSHDYIDALRFVDQPPATAALKRWVAAAWQTRAKYQAGGRHLQSLSAQQFRSDLQNSAGDERRTTILGEVARRDPNWLAGEALRRMASDFFPERAAGYHVFRSLTARSMGFDPEAFHAERQPALARLEAWWREHRGEERRDQWLLSYFAEAGFKIERFDDDAVPTLLKALEADPQTHELALEQLERITDLLFNVRNPSSYRWQLYNIAMVTGKLRARGWLEDP